MSKFKSLKEFMAFVWEFISIIGLSLTQMLILAYVGPPFIEHSIASGISEIQVAGSIILIIFGQTYLMWKLSNSIQKPLRKVKKID